MRLIRSATVRITVYFPSVLVAHRTQCRFSRCSPSTRALRSIYTLLRTRGHYFTIHIAPACARPQPYPVCVFGLQSRLFAPAHGLVGFPRARWCSVFDSRSWLDGGHRRVDLIQRA